MLNIVYFDPSFLKFVVSFHVAMAKRGRASAVRGGCRQKSRRLAASRRQPESKTAHFMVLCSYIAL